MSTTHQGQGGRVWGGGGECATRLVSIQSEGPASSIIEEPGPPAGLHIRTSLRHIRAQLERGEAELAQVPDTMHPLGLEPGGC